MAATDGLDDGESMHLFGSGEMDSRRYRQIVTPGGTEVAIAVVLTPPTT